MPRVARTPRPSPRHAAAAHLLAEIEQETGLPAEDVVRHGAVRLADALREEPRTEIGAGG